MENKFAASLSDLTSANKSRFIETVQLILSDQAVLDELKNNYYESATSDPDARTTDGMKSFAMERINAIIDSDPNFKDVDKSEIITAKWWIVNEILLPIAVDIDMTQQNS